jgi:UDP-4-amino-4,6-dideoxy-N-acetyl-beta-L-altrosamine N-acetyltransferase
MKIKFITLRKKHLEIIRHWRNSPEVSRYMNTAQHITSQSQSQWFAAIKNDPACKYWVVNVDGKDIGLVYLTNIDNVNKRCYWGDYIGDLSMQGKGLGKLIEYNVLNYVFGKMNLHKLCGEVLEFNQKVLYIHQYFGFTIDGILRQHISKNGQYYNLVNISYLKTEWDKAKSNFNMIKAEIE